VNPVSLPAVVLGRVPEFAGGVVAVGGVVSVDGDGDGDEAVGESGKSIV
jgi:hypothetical protein